MCFVLKGVVGEGFVVLVDNIGGCIDVLFCLVWIVDSFVLYVVVGINVDCVYGLFDVVEILVEILEGVFLLGLLEILGEVIGIIGDILCFLDVVEIFIEILVGFFDVVDIFVIGIFVFFVVVEIFVDGIIFFCVFLEIFVDGVVLVFDDVVEILVDSFFGLFLIFFFGGVFVFLIMIDVLVFFIIFVVKICMRF